MKNSLKKYLLIGAGLFFVFACSKEKEIDNVDAQPEKDVYVYTFGIGSAEAPNVDTKSILQSDANGLYMAWESTDKLNSWAYSTVTNNYSYNNESSVNTSDNPVTFQITSYRALNKGDMVYCKFPYATGSGTSPEAVSMTIASSQTQNGTVFNTSSMPMVSLPFEMPTDVASQSNAKAGNVLFYNVGSIIEFDIFSPTSLYADETIESVQFTSANAIAGNFTMDLTAISESDLSTLDIDGYSVKGVTTNIEGALSVGTATNKDNATKVYMVIAPGDYTGTVVVNTNAAQYTYTISSAISFARAGVKRLGLNLEKGGARKVVGLPNGDYVILAHYASGYKAMSGVANGTRLAQESFSLWNGSDEQVVLQDKNIVWTLAKSGTNYTLTNKENGKQLNYGSSGTASTAASGKTLTITEGTGANEGMYTVTNSTFTLRHNSSSSWFAFYNTTTTMTNYFYFVRAVVKTKLATPENVMADVENEDEVVVVWDSVENAESYDVTLNGITQNTTELSYRFVDVPVGTYTVSVIAKNADTAKYDESDEGVSNSVKVGTPPLAKPVIDAFTQKATGFAASWTAGDAFTTSYSWDLYVGSVADENLIGTGVTTDDSIDIAFDSADFPETSFTADETYYLVVTAIASGYASTASEAANFVATGSVTTYKWIKITTASQIEVGGQYILGGVHNNTTYSYMPNTESSSANPTTTTSSLISKTEIADEDVTKDMIWDFVDAGSDLIYIQSHANASHKLNTTSSTGTNIRISSGNTTHNKWTITVNDDYGWDYHNDSKYLTVYAANAWRNYENNETNRNGTFIIFKRVEE